ncbi:MAG: GreA/GreB family elongation factor [Planctomycetes bacterium]|nr:GreA/GreB family elongation factor [Planctomycetota bacterium]
MSDTNLLSLARSQDLDGLQQAWQESLQSPGEVSAYCDSLKALCDNDALGFAAKLGAQTVDTLVDSGRRDDAITLCSTMMKCGALSDSLAHRSFELIEAEYGNEDWYPLALEMSGISLVNLSSDAFEKFDRVRHYTKGNVLYHRAGWGEGIIERFDTGSRELTVRFANGRTQEFPLSSALDSLRPLPADDLRAMRLRSPDELERMAKEEPAVLIRKALSVYRGEANSTQIKSELSPSVIPQKKWASFWKRAKTAAANDPWLEITGSSTRPTFTLRKRPLSLVEEAERSLTHAGDLGEAIATCRDYIARGLDATALQVILGLASNRVDQAIEKGNESHANLLDGIVFLEQHGTPVSKSAAEETRALLSKEGSDEVNLRALDELTTQKSKEHAVTLLPKAFGDDWADRCIAAIMDCPASVLEALVDELHEHKQASKLAPVWDKVAPYPRRHPMLLFQLGRLYAEGLFDEYENRPEIITVGRVLMTLTRVVSAERKGDSLKNRIRTRLTSLLTGRRALLSRCFDNIDRDNLAAYLQIAERAGDDFPQEVMDAVLRAVADKFPDLTRAPETPFWEEKNSIYVTSAGLARQKEDYRVLVDEKIPANSKAIGNAASLGDLSENSEWEAAMEEQRNLTGRAQEMDRELRMAKRLDDVELPTDVVSPGMRVSFTYLESGEKASYRLLGPWDCTSEDIINYRAPIAAAFLGRRVGDESTLPGTGGDRDIRIDSFESIL